MFEEVTVRNFRGIRACSISELKNVNLFFGKNNCGKSSLLDAIFLISGQSNPILPININFFRDYSKVTIDVLKMNFYQLNNLSPISISAIDGESRALDISIIESGRDTIQLKEKEDSLSSQIEKRFGFKLDYVVNGSSFSSQIEINESDVRKAETRIDDRYKEHLYCTYLSPRFNYFASIKGLSSVIQNKDEQFIIEALRLIEPKIIDFVFTGEEMLVDIGLNERIPINFLGDGARKMVAILTSIYNCKDGILLIDEIDNGFHHSIMADLWMILLTVSRRNNTQIFATTHDKDSIRGLITAAKEKKYESKVSSYHLQKHSNGELIPYRFTIDNLDYAIEQNIEIR